MLTQREYSACPTGMLCKVARQHANRIGITLSMGSIIVIDGDRELAEPAGAPTPAVGSAA